MLSPHTNLEAEAAALRRENYNVSIVDDAVLIARDIPYVTSSREVRRGVLAFPVEATTEGVIPSSTHCAYFKGDIPCAASGTPLNTVAITQVTFNLSKDLGQATLQLSCKKNHPAPGPSGYVSVKEKLETYIAILEVHARAIDPSITARTGGVPPDTATPGPFRYPDSASARVGIGHLNERFLSQRIGIIGLGGTGSYVLDLVAKTPVPEIHLFDADLFRPHNAFRAPGAASKEEVASGESKVNRYVRIYDVFRTGIIPHPTAASEEARDILSHLTFTFLCVDRASESYAIAKLLVELSIPFVDVGMGVKLIAEGTPCLLARVRTSYWAPGAAAVISAPSTVDAAEDDYSSNIQIAELNSLNAAFAVIRWKKALGYYQDFEQEAVTVYDSNMQTLNRI